MNCRSFRTVKGRLRSFAGLLPSSHGRGSCPTGSKQLSYRQLVKVLMTIARLLRTQSHTCHP